MYKIIALFGKAGAGKDTVLNKLCDGGDFNKIVSCTTRPPRDYEKNGIDYHFLSNIEFLEKVANGDMLEATEFRDWYYGTTLSSLDENKINIGVFNTKGILNIIETIKFFDKNIDLLAVEIFADDKTRLIRQLNRESNPDCAEICRRFQTDEKDFEKFYDELDFPCYQVHNDDLDYVCDHLTKLFKTFK